jgi:hypothetical protein
MSKLRGSARDERAVVYLSVKKKREQSGRESEED